MFDKLKDMGNMLKKAKEMKSQMAAMQNELRKMSFTGYGYGKKIEVIVNGEMEIMEINLNPEIILANKQKDLEKGLREAVNDALKRSKSEAATKFSSIAGGLGLNLPGM